MIHDVEGPDGKIIKVEGPDDATDDELISVARSYYSQSKTQAAKPAAKAESDAIIPGQLPALSKPEDLSKENAAKAPDAKQEETAQPAASGSVFEPLSKGDFGQAWENVPQTTRDLITYATPPVLGATALAGAGLKYLKSSQGIRPDVQGGDGIRARTIGGNAPTPPAGGGAAPVAEPSFNPKEAKIAADIENKYGFSWKDIKSNFGVSDVTITNPLEAQMLADSYKNQQAAPAAPVATPETPAAPSERVTFTVQDIQSASPGQTEWKIGDRTLNAQEYADWLNQQAQSPAEAPKTPTAAAETPKAPATPPAEAPKAGVAPPEGMREQYSKGKKNPIGPSAFNHLANNLGLEKAIEVWESTYGKKNVPYEQYMAEYSKAAGKDMPGPRQPLAEGQKPGGSFGKPQYIPEYIKGAATPGGMTAAGGAALGALIAKPSIENAIQSAKEGDTAMSASYLSNLLDFHPVTAIANALFGLSPDELKTLRNAKQAQTVGAGRGVAPPSAYRR